MHKFALITWSIVIVLTAYAQSDRVGVTAAGNNLAVRPQPCSTNSLGTLQSGMDGAVNGTSQTCNNQSWQPARWTNGLQGWSAQGAGSTLYLIPLPGSGVFPNVNAPMAYPVRVGPDAAALNVRSGPGTNFSIITSKATGSTGWAFEAFNQTGTNIVWWKIRWDDGVIGWSVGEERSSSLTEAALRMAWRHRQPDTDQQALLHHSDRGCQYASGAYQSRLQAYGIQASMSGVGCVYDNALMESFFATLKTELGDTFASRWEAECALLDYLEGYYNRCRPHLALGYLSPIAYEQKWTKDRGEK